MYVIKYENIREPDYKSILLWFLFIDLLFFFYSLPVSRCPLRDLFLLMWSTHSDADFWSSCSCSCRLRREKIFQLISSVLKSICCVSSDDCLLYFLVVTESGQATSAVDNSSVYGDATHIMGPIQGNG